MIHYAQTPTQTVVSILIAVIYLGTFICTLEHLASGVPRTGLPSHSAHVKHSTLPPVIDYWTQFGVADYLYISQ